MTKQEKIHKYMKGLKGYITKNFTLVKEWEDKDGYIGYLFIMDDNYYYTYSGKDDVYVQHMGHVDNKPNGVYSLLQEK